jgi:pimeloyl-ACP methyl ester carboxylesterase
MSAPESEVNFNIAVSDERLSILQQKLALTIFPDELEDAGWNYGAPLADIRRLVSRWKEGYDWRKHEAQLNAELPQFTRDIEVEGHGTLNIHYVHKKSEVVDAIPLLFVHGWPGTFIEVQKILPLLVQADPEHPSFHVVALGLPGYGFPEAPKKPGFELTQYAEVGNKLMLALGYNEYVTQGGDWGHLITQKMAQVYGHKHSKAWHSNFPLSTGPHPFHSPLLFIWHFLFSYTPAEKEGLKRTEWFRRQGRGYSAIQSTQPQTLGYSLADSPVGLLSWIYEKLVLWTDNYIWDDDEGPTASLRIYYEVVKAYPTRFNQVQATTIPMGYSYFLKELYRFPRRWLKAPNLIFESEHDSGGHFAAHEKPEELVGDLRKMFGKSGPAFGVVPGKVGYA